MVDYSKWDKLAALISSSDDDDDADHDQTKYDIMLRDKFNTSIHANKTTVKSSKPSEQDGEFKSPPNNDIQDQDEDMNDIANTFDPNIINQYYEEVAPIFIASNEMYNKYKTKYATQIKEISDAAKKITAPKLNRTQYAINNKINQWSHEISMDTLNLIFEFAINPKDPVPHANDKKLYDADKDPRRFTIKLLLVCKNWRLCCLSNDQFWLPVIEFVLQGGKKRGMSWKKLMIVPKKYLDEFCRCYNIDTMTSQEGEQYKNILTQYEFELTDDIDSNYGLDFTDDSFQTNPFLTIQCLKYCRNTCELYLSGILCDDIFYAIGKYCNDLRSLSVPFIRSGNCAWFRHLVSNDSRCMDTLYEINLERSYWCNDEALMYLGKLRNLQSIEMDRLYNISAKGLKYLFEGEDGEVRGKEMRNIYLTRGMKFYNDSVDFMKLMIKNGSKMMQFEFTQCKGFNDDMLELLQDKNALPNLRAINIGYTGCSTEMVEKLKAKRPNVEIDFEEIEW